MPQELFDSVHELISSLIHHELGSTEFSIVLSVFVITWVIVARLLMGLLKSDRGFIAAFIALVLPLFFGLLAYGVVDLRVVPRIEADWAGTLLAPAAFAFVFLLMILYVSRRVFVVSGFAAIMIFAFATAAAVGAYFGAEITLQMLEKGGEQLKQREERSQETIESVL